MLQRVMLYRVALGEVIFEEKNNCYRTQHLLNLLFLLSTTELSCWNGRLSVWLLVRDFPADIHQFDQLVEPPVDGKGFLLILQSSSFKINHMLGSEECRMRSLEKQNSKQQILPLQLVTLHLGKTQAGQLII